MSSPDGLSVQRSFFCPCRIFAHWLTWRPTGFGIPRTTKKKSIPVPCADDRRGILYLAEGVLAWVSNIHPLVPFLRSCCSCNGFRKGDSCTSIWCQRRAWSVASKASRMHPWPHRLIFGFQLGFFYDRSDPASPKLWEFDPMREFLGLRGVF